MKHQFKPVIDQTSQVLILGSFPSVKSREFSFYYMHPKNRFWLIMSKLFGEDFSHVGIEKKIQLLKKHHIALYDVIKSCRIEGSQDASITDVEVADIEGLINQSKIKAIFLNGRKAEQLFKQHFPKFISIAHYLPSTSPANARYRLNDLYQEWKIIKDYLDNMKAK